MKERMKLNLPPKLMVFVKNLNPCVTKLRVLVLCFPSLTDNSIYLACPLSLLTWEVMGAKNKNRQIERKNLQTYSCTDCIDNYEEGKAVNVFCH